MLDFLCFNPDLISFALKLISRNRYVVLIEFPLKHLLSSANISLNKLLAKILCKVDGIGLFVD